MLLYEIDLLITTRPEVMKQQQVLGCCRLLFCCCSLHSSRESKLCSLKYITKRSQKDMKKL